jgi:hypothetical protein
MLEMVVARRNANVVEERYDLFSGLLDAAQDELVSEAAISDDELIGGYPTSRSFGIFWKATYSPSQETCLSFFWPDMRWDLPLLCVVFRKTVPTDHIAYAMLLICLVGPLS